MLRLNYITVILLVLGAMLSAKVSPRGLENALDISTSGVIAQRTKAQVLAENIANADTTKTDQGTPYKRKVVVLRPAENFSRRASMGKGVLNGIVVASIEEEKNASANFQKVYNPQHPDADVNGYVFYPDIDLTQELVELTQTSGAFENNVVVFNNTKAMMKSSLELGGQ